MVLFFLDRDPKLFRFIINYLRTGVVCWPEIEKQRKMIVEEFLFFNIELNRRTGSKEFVYTSNFDKNGFFYYLGTEGGTKDWKNPRSMGVVEIFGSEGYYKIENNSAVRYNIPEDYSLAFEYNPDPVSCLTSSTTNQNFTICLNTMMFKPNVITISCSYMPQTYLLNLKWSGSNDKNSGFVDFPIQQEKPIEGKTRTWLVTVNDYYRYFRISGTSQVLISGLEMYGQMKDIDK